MGRQHSIIEHRANYFYLLLEDDYLAMYEKLAAELDPQKEREEKKLSGPSDCKAMIASVLEQWMNSKRATAKCEEDLYVYYTYDEWVNTLRGRYKRSTIIQCLKEMEEEGEWINEKGTKYIGTIKKRHFVQNTYQYMLHLPVVQGLLSQLPEQSPFEQKPRPSLGRPSKSRSKINDIKINGLISDDGSLKTDGQSVKTNAPFYTHISNTDNTQEEVCVETPTGDTHAFSLQGETDGSHDLHPLGDTNAVFDSQLVTHIAAPSRFGQDDAGSVQADACPVRHQGSGADYGQAGKRVAQGGQDVQTEVPSQFPHRDAHSSVRGIPLTASSALSRPRDLVDSDASRSNVPELSLVDGTGQDIAAQGESHELVGDHLASVSPSQPDVHSRPSGKHREGVTQAQPEGRRVAQQNIGAVSSSGIDVSRGVSRSIPQPVVSPPTGGPETPTVSHGTGFERASQNGQVSAGVPGENFPQSPVLSPDTPTMGTPVALPNSGNVTQATNQPPKLGKVQETPAWLVFLDAWDAEYGPASRSKLVVEKVQDLTGRMKGTFEQAKLVVEEIKRRGKNKGNRVTLLMLYDFWDACQPVQTSSSTVNGTQLPEGCSIVDDQYTRHIRKQVEARRAARAQQQALAQGGS